MLPFRNLYTRNPIGLTHCAAESLINPYSMPWMRLINGFGPLSFLITQSRPAIMTAGSELEAITNPAKHAAREPCLHMHICNYVHTRKALSPAIGCMPLMSSCGRKWIVGTWTLPQECEECVQLCNSVTGRVKYSPRA